MDFVAAIEKYPALALLLAAGGGLAIYRFAQSRDIYPKLPPAAQVDSQQVAMAYVSPEMLANAQAKLRAQIEEELSAQQNQYYQSQPYPYESQNWAGIGYD